MTQINCLIPKTLKTMARIRLKIPFAFAFFSAVFLVTTFTGLFANLALAQTVSLAPKPAACPNPDQVEPIHLYGLWRGEVEGSPKSASPTGSLTASQTVTLRFEKHPDLSGSVMGSIQRGNVKSQCAGDVDNGVLALEESNDGKSISATWTGQVVAGSCGKEISGTWNNFSNNTSHKFVLRKSAGWD